MTPVAGSGLRAAAASKALGVAFMPGGSPVGRTPTNSEKNNAFGPRPLPVNQDPNPQARKGMEKAVERARNSPQPEKTNGGTYTRTSNPGRLT
jgi:hypothetical protein